MSRRVLLIGWDAADWKLILPLMDAGKLPHLSRLVEDGVIGKMTTVRPRDATVAWTSIATGRRPFDHGVLAAFEPAPNGEGVRPVSSLGRKTKALWNILNQSGLKCQVVGWPGSHPAEPLDGVVVSDHFPQPIHGPEGTWPLRAGTVHPPRLNPSLAELRVHTAEISGVDLLMFVPKLAQMETAIDARLSQIAAALAESGSLHAASTHLLETEPWHFHAVCFPAIERISREFMNYRPPRTSFVSDGDFEMFSGVVDAAYVLHDLFLGRLLELAGDDATVVVLSDRGCASGEHRHDKPLDEPDSPPERTEVGMFVMRGPGVRRDALVYGGSVLDVAPTLLHYFGLPAGADMEGKVLREIFEEPREPRQVSSWEDEAGHDGMHPPERRFDPIAAAGRFPSRNAAPDDNAAVRSALFRARLAESFLSAQREDAAIPVLEELWADDPAESQYGYQLMIAYMAVERADLARRSFDRILENKKRHAATARRAWQALEQRDPATLSAAERARKLKLWKQSRTNLSGMAFLRAWLLHAERRPEEALEAIESADEHKVYNRVGLLRLKADCLLNLARWSEADAVYRQVLELDPENPEAHLGLANLCFRTRCYKEAAAHAKSSISLRYFNPLAHYVYGGSVYRCGQPKAAADALCVAVEQSPHLIGAYQRLIALYRGPLSDPERAAVYSARMRRAREDKRVFDQKRRQGLDQLHGDRNTGVKPHSGGETLQALFGQD